tara:strand:+ start:279 stop:497 length:219 start_codon:yes stop_codon:yes gene_type:complete
MKADNQVINEVKNIRNALNNMYDVLNISLYKKNTAAKTTYSEVIPFNLVADNFEYISTKIREIQDSEIIGDE